MPGAHAVPDFDQHKPSSRAACGFDFVARGVQFPLVYLTGQSESSPDCLRKVNLKVPG
jgi:hypothetical protein